MSTLAAARTVCCGEIVMHTSIKLSLFNFTRKISRGKDCFVFCGLFSNNEQRVNDFSFRTGA